MKKTVKIVSMALLLVAVMVMLVSCSSFKKIKGNFEDAGYTLVENNDEANTITAELEEGNISCTAHLFQKKGDLLTYNALILEFKSDEALNKALSESENFAEAQLANKTGKKTKKAAFSVIFFNIIFSSYGFKIFLPRWAVALCPSPVGVGDGMKLSMCKCWCTGSVLSSWSARPRFGDVFA